jgi:hypothetical protein
MMFGKLRLFSRYELRFSPGYWIAILVLTLSSLDHGFQHRRMVAPSIGLVKTYQVGGYCMDSQVDEAVSDAGLSWDKC